VRGKQFTTKKLLSIEDMRELAIEHTILSVKEATEDTRRIP